jgi:hypothetical protein
MATIMNISGYEIERGVVASEEYGDEIMCAAWNPQLASVHNRPIINRDKHAALASEMANVDIATFLQEMYKFQR